MTDFTLNIHMHSEADLLTVATALVRARQAGAALEGLGFSETPQLAAAAPQALLAAPQYQQQPEPPAVYEPEPAPQYAPAPQQYHAQHAPQAQQYAQPAPQQYAPAPAPQQYAPAPQAAQNGYTNGHAPQQHAAPAQATVAPATLAEVQQAFTSAMGSKTGLTPSAFAGYLNYLQPGCSNLKVLAPAHYGAARHWLLSGGWKQAA